MYKKFIPKFRIVYLFISLKNIASHSTVVYGLNCTPSYKTHVAKNRQVIVLTI